MIIPVLNGQKPEGRGNERKNIGKEKRGRTGALTTEAATTMTITKGRAIRLRCSNTGAYGRLEQIKHCFNLSASQINKKICSSINEATKHN